MFDKDNYQLVKDLKRDVEENFVKYEEILFTILSEAREVQSTNNRVDKEL